MNLRLGLNRVHFGSPFFHNREESDRVSKEQNSSFLIKSYAKNASAIEPVQQPSQITSRHSSPSRSYTKPAKMLKNMQLSFLPILSTKQQQNAGVYGNDNALIDLQSSYAGLKSKKQQQKSIKVIEIPPTAPFEMSPIQHIERVSPTTGSGGQVESPSKSAKVSLAQLEQIKQESMKYIDVHVENPSLNQQHQYHQLRWRSKSISNNHIKQIELDESLIQQRRQNLLKHPYFFSSIDQSSDKQNEQQQQQQYHLNGTVKSNRVEEGGGGKYFKLKDIKAAVEEEEENKKEGGTNDNLQTFDRLLILNEVRKQNKNNENERSPIQDRKLRVVLMNQKPLMGEKIVQSEAVSLRNSMEIRINEEEDSQLDQLKWKSNLLSAKDKNGLRTGGTGSLCKYLFNDELNATSTSKSQLQMPNGTRCSESTSPVQPFVKPMRIQSWKTRRLYGRSEGVVNGTAGESGSQAQYQPMKVYGFESSSGDLLSFDHIGDERGIIGDYEGKGYVSSVIVPPTAAAAHNNNIGGDDSKNRVTFNAFYPWQQGGSTSAASEDIGRKNRMMRLNRRQNRKQQQLQQQSQNNQYVVSSSSCDGYASVIDGQGREIESRQLADKDSFEGNQNGFGDFDIIEYFDMRKNNKKKV